MGKLSQIILVLILDVCAPDGHVYVNVRFSASSSLAADLWPPLF